MNKHILSAALVAQCLLATAVHAASFDCAHAGSANEKIICGDTELSAMDDRLGKAFRQARARAEDKRAFRKQSDVQWSWREQNCHDRACLVQWYGRRQAELETLAGGSVSLAANLPAKSTVAAAAAEAATAAPVAAVTGQPMPSTVPPIRAAMMSLAAPATPAAAPAAAPAAPAATAAPAVPTPVPAVATAAAIVPVSMASVPPRGNGLKLSLSATQIAGVAPAGALPWPHYVRVDKGEYFYEDKTHDNALVSVRYYGIEHGQHILEVSRGKQISRYTCSADCAYFGELPLPGDEQTDMIIRRNDASTLSSIIVTDAINGLLVPATVR